MIDDAFRARLPRFAGPLLALYARMGWTPNQLSVIGCSIALAASLAVAGGHPWAALALWWLSRLVDGTDGVFARHAGRATDFGAYLDVVLDMAAYGAMVLAFAFRHPDFLPAWMAMLFLYVLCIASALALGAQEAKRSLPARDERGLRLGAGLAEGGETGLAYSAFLLWPDGLALTTTLWVALLALTVAARTLLAWRVLGPAATASSAAAEREADRQPDSVAASEPHEAPGRVNRGGSEAVRSEGKPLRSRSDSSGM